VKRYGEALVAAAEARRVIVLTDRRVERLYRTVLARSLEEAGVRHEWIVIAEGERSKSLATFARVLERLVELGCDRRTLLVNFGGGVVSDLGGFVAATFMRGLRYANCATTLIGQLDASIGGKVAVNARVAKNLFGAFHHPAHVGCDPTLVRTLSSRDFRSGMAEAIKVAILDGPPLFGLLEREHARIRARDPYLLTEVIGLAAQIKMQSIARDPYEQDLRRPLNLGHTIGHPIETEYSYKRIRHGEAVAIGLGVATCVASRRRLIPAADAGRIFDLLVRYDLLGFLEPVRADALFEHMRYVRLIRGSRLHFVLPTRVGGVTITEDVSRADLAQAFEDYEDVVAARGARRGRPACT
jgi:3-dehydroquinate synthase